MAKSNGRFYKSYMFRDKDPVIDELRDLIEKHEGGLGEGVLQRINKGGGPSTSCMREWFYGKTKRPTNPAIEAAGRAIGFKRVWVTRNRIKP